MTIFYVDKLSSINAWGSSERVRISPLFEIEEDAIKWAKNKGYDINSNDSYAEYRLCKEETN